MPPQPDPGALRAKGDATGAWTPPGGTSLARDSAGSARTPLLLFWVVVALAVILPAVRAQRSRGQSQARRPSTEAPNYDDYYYDEEGADEEAASKKPEKSSSSQSPSRGSSGSSGTSRGGKPEPPSDEDYDAPPPSSSKSSSSSSTAKPSSSSSSKHKSGLSTDTKPPAPSGASDPAGDSGAEEPPQKKGPVSPSALFLAPRKNRLHRPNVHFAARPRPTLPSFIKHPPPLGAISTTVTPKPRSAAVAVTEEPKVSRSTVKPKSSSASSKRGGSGFSGGAAGRKRDRSTTESPASTDGDRSNRRFGGNGQKKTARPRFRAGSTA
ncbi:putative protein TPRXL [Rhipicephalus sanguineus]|uniref:putative protein TPRXL n=1 Tax=Rhipicephalus sanguineus TaxID=34632 RepID=UPI0018949F1B|nr:putative protein TPRXL [Rhipicephalus sanguineus]